MERVRPRERERERQTKREREREKNPKKWTYIEWLTDENTLHDRERKMEKRG